MSLHKNAFYTLLTQIPSAVLGVAAGIFITRILGTEGKGVYSLFQADIELLILFFSMNISSGIVYFVANRKIEIEKLMGFSIIIVLFGMILSMVTLTVAYAVNLQNLIIPELRDSLPYLGYLLGSVGLSLINTIISSVMQGKTAFKAENTFLIIISIVNLVVFGLMFVAFLGDISIGTVPNIFLSTFIILSVHTIARIVWYVVKVGVPPSFQFSFSEDVKPILKFTSATYVAQLVIFLNYRFDLWLVDYYWGVKWVGIYAVAAGIGHLFFFISRPIASVLFPYLTKSEKDDSVKHFVFFSRFTFSIVFSALLVAVLLSDWLIPLVYGKEFSESVLTFKLIATGVLFAATTHILSAVLKAKNMVIYNLIAAFLGLLVTVTLDFVLIPRYGIKGAAVATTLAYFTTFFAQFIVVLVKLKLPLANYFVLTFSDIKLAAAMLRKKGEDIG